MPALLKDYSGFQPFILHHAHFKFIKQEWFALPASDRDCQATATHDVFAYRMRTGFVIINSFFRSTSGHGSLNKHQCSPFFQEYGFTGISETNAAGPQPLVGCSPDFTPGLLSTCFSCQGNCSLHSSSSLTANRQKLPRFNNRSVVLSCSMGRFWESPQWEGADEVVLSPSSQFCFAQALAYLSSSHSEQNYRTLPSLLQNTLACLIVPGN